jgi:transposase-like protein
MGPEVIRDQMPLILEHGYTEPCPYCGQSGEKVDSTFGRAYQCTGCHRRFWEIDNNSDE